MRKNLEAMVKAYKEGNEIEKVLSSILEELDKTVIKYYCYKYQNSGIEADDIKAELYLECYIALDDFIEGQAEFKTYFSNRCNNKILNLIRDNKRDKRVAKDDEGRAVMDISYEVCVENGDIVEAEGEVGNYTDVEVLMLINALHLKEDEKIICRGFMAGLRPTEIAEKMGVSPSTITYKVKKIRAKMQAQLNFAF